MMLPSEKFPPLVSMVTGCGLTRRNSSVPAACSCFTLLYLSFEDFMHRGGLHFPVSTFI